MSGKILRFVKAFTDDDPNGVLLKTMWDTEEEYAEAIIRFVQRARSHGVILMIEELSEEAGRAEELGLIFSTYMEYWHAIKHGTIRFEIFLS